MMFDQLVDVDIAEPITITEHKCRFAKKRLNFAQTRTGHCFKSGIGHCDVAVDAVYHTDEAINARKFGLTLKFFNFSILLPKKSTMVSDL